jgi:hypothetical protein
MTGSDDLYSVKTSLDTGFHGAGKTAKDSKSTEEYIDLADLNPAGVRLPVSHDEGYSSNRVDFERSDAATKIVETIALEVAKSSN